MARPRTWRRGPLLGLAALLVLVAAAYLSGVGTDGGAGTARSAGTSAATGVPSTAERSDPASGLPVAALEDLPVQVRQTVDLIAADGPFPHDEDGSTFFNREGLLPDQAEGWYREYTVPTPGEGDRGARRVVAGQDGTYYYTADHYDSFVVLAGGVDG